METARWMLAALALTVMAFPCPAAGAEGAPRTIVLDVELDPASRRLSGSCTVSLVNSSASELSLVPVYLYPNLLTSPGADLVDVTFPHRFPGGFSAGAMEIAGVWANSQAAQVKLTAALDHPNLLAWVALPHAAAPGARISLEISFSTLIPERFGPFGEVDDTIVLLGGWYPLVPHLGPGGFALDDVNPVAEYAVRVRSRAPGLLVIGDRLLSLSPGKAKEVTLSDWHGPVLLYNKLRWHLTQGHVIGGAELLQVTSAQQSAPSPEGERVRATIVDALTNSRSEATLERPFLLLEAPLREMVAIPLRGGLLYSDLTFEVSPIATLESRHAEDLQSAVVASNLLSQSRMDLFEALLAINLVQFVRWSEGRADPVFLRRFVQQVELWGALDKMGTDPQAHFQTSMFFTPELPSPLARSPSLFARNVPAPRSAARMVYNLLGAKRVLRALSDTLEKRSRLQPSLLREARLEEVDMLRRALQAMCVDLELVGGEETPSGYEVEVCQRGDEGPLPLELRVSGAGPARHLVAPCRQRCCTIATGVPGTPRVTVDPHGLFLQRERGNDHPRRNDRNYLDLKWVLNRPYISFAGGDRLPTMGLELQVEPRWDLHHRFVVQPNVNANRGSLSALWRYGFGRRVRSTYLSDSLSLGVRTAFPLDGSSGSLLGPVISYLHFTRQSRMNPFTGNWSYLFAYPTIAPGFDKFGSRFGAMTSQLFGRSPDHILAVRVNGDTGVGWIPGWDVPATGGLEGLRALGSFQGSARHRVGGSMEYRFMPLRNLHAPLLRLGYITALQFAFFVDAATISDEIEALFAPEETLVDVGVGFRPHGDVFGVLPGIVSLDLAYLLPILGAAEGGINLVLSFYQPF